MRLSKSKFLELHNCHRAGWLTVHRPDLCELSKSATTLMDCGTNFGKAAQSIFGTEFDVVETVDDKAKMIEDTKKLIMNGSKIIAEASFSHNGCFCSTDIFRIVDLATKTVEVYEVKGTTEIKDQHLLDMAYQYYVISGLGFNIVKFGHVHINKDYMLIGKLNVNELFTIEDILPTVITNATEVALHVEEYKAILDREQMPACKIGMQCHSPYDCPYFQTCVGLEGLSSPNVFDLKGRGITFKKKVSMFNKGIKTYPDILEHPKEINQMRLDEVRSTVENKPLPIQYGEIQELLDDITYPVYFLDFESYQDSVPEWEYSKPYSQIPFQYSLHYYEYEGGPLMHKEFIAPVGEDPRIAVAKRLVEDIPIDACVLAYNCQFEKMVIKELGSLFPQYYYHLGKIYQNIKDLMTPFEKHWYYLPDFKGSYSIKYVLPALFPDDPECDYSKLDDIHNGTEAMDSYANLRNMSKEEQEKIIKALYEYCKLDTYAMVKIYHFLVDLMAKRVASFNN